MGTIAPLPIYPCTQARKAFSPSQLAHLHSNLANAIEQVIALPPTKQDTSTTRVFISSYASDAAQQTLQGLIWEDAQPPKHDDHLCGRVLLLAERVASAAGLEPKILLDLCVSFPLKTTRLKSILSAALATTPDLPSTFTVQVVPAFTALLSPSGSSGLYALRKTARCLLSLLRPSPSALVRPFTHDKEFILTLARIYDEGLTAISRFYGGIRIGVPNHELDHWEKTWLETKVDLIDIFHVLMTMIVRDMSAASGEALAQEVDRTFGIVFELLELGSHSVTVGSPGAVPFLDRPLVADYQYAYDLGRTLASALRHATRDDARMELLESSLRSLDVKSPGGNTKDPGVLKLILRSSTFVIPTPSNTFTSAGQPMSSNKGKGKDSVPAPKATPRYDADLDLQVTQVLDIFPDRSPEYIRKLLTHPSLPLRGNPERVIEALLEGTAPDEDVLGNETTDSITTVAPIERRNVFDHEVMDLNRVHIGKKTQHGTSLTRDKLETERMKAEILRLAEAMSQDSDEESGQARALDVIDLDDEEVPAKTVNVLGDGEDSDDDEADGEGHVEPIKPETILELAYIRDPKLFERDAETRRSKSRADLKQQTGWTDEQIEGWRIMLERNPKKERMLQKHEFSGNRAVNVPFVRGIGNQPGGSQRGDGSTRGRGRGKGRGRGRGSRGRGQGETKNEVARERAFKEKHKSGDRKRGHDKKMAKTGPGPSG